MDSTTSSGSGTVSAGLSGGGSNDVTLTVPNTINAGDALSVTVEDVINPGVASSTYSITLVGAVTGPAPTPVKTTTTTAPKPKPKPHPKPKPRPKPVPLIALLTRQVRAHDHAVVITLRCSRARCRGQVVLRSGKTVFGRRAYNLPATGRPARIVVNLNELAMKRLERAKDHRLRPRLTARLDGGRNPNRLITVLA